MRNRKSQLKAKRRASRARARARRRGVLLLVVLSMLVLFMLVGTAFLMSSNQSRIAMKHAARERGRALAHTPSPVVESRSPAPLVLPSTV